MAGVIGIHMSSFFPDSGGEAPLHKLMHVLATCCFWCVPAFVILSGYHAETALATLPASAFLRKRLGRILPPLLFWSLVYTRLPPNGGWTTLKAVALNWIHCAPVFHLWFLFMLAGLYLFAPLCSRWGNRSGFLLPLAVFQAVVLSNPEGYSSGVFRYPILISVPYVGLFTLGCRLSSSGIGHLAGRLAILSSAGYFSFMAFVALSGGNKLPYPIFHYLGLGGLWGGLSVTTAILHAGRSIPTRLATRLCRMSRLVFGTYLLHPLIMGMCAKIPIPGLTNGLWCRPILFFSIFATSMALVAILLKIPFLRRTV